MAQYLVEGGSPLKGEITPRGNKNAVLPILAATLLTEEPCTITNVPGIGDTATMAQLLQSLGAKVDGLGTEKLVVDTSSVKNWHLDPELVKKLRASVLFLGPLLARFGQVRMRYPGGCVIGRRSVETHFEALDRLGASIKIDQEDYVGVLAKPQAARIFLDEASVTATENALMVASLVPGRTVIEDAACEPHVRNLGEFLVSMGADIQGLGSNRLVINGVKKLHGATVRVVPDHVEIGTWAIAAAVTRGELLIKDIVPEDLDMVLLYLSRFGVDWRLEGQNLRIRPSALKAAGGKVQTRPWPGFSTDLMSPLVVLATQAAGSTLCHDWMYESRMFFVDKLIAMGAQIVLCDPHRALVTGPTPLRGKVMESPDIRAGMALILAALCAEGQSIIKNIDLVERGYERPDLLLNKLGAKIERAENGTGNQEVKC